MKIYTYLYVYLNYARAAQAIVQLFAFFWSSLANVICTFISYLLCSRRAERVIYLVSCLICLISCVLCAHCTMTVLYLIVSHLRFLFVFFSSFFFHMCVSLSICLATRHTRYVLSRWRQRSGWVWDRRRRRRRSDTKQQKKLNEISNDASRPPSVTLMLFLLFWCLWSSHAYPDLHTYGFYLLLLFTILFTVWKFYYC